MISSLNILVSGLFIFLLIVCSVSFIVMSIPLLVLPMYCFRQVLHSNRYIILLDVLRSWLLVVVSGLLSYVLVLYIPLNFVFLSRIHVLMLVE